MRKYLELFKRHQNFSKLPIVKVKSPYITKEGHSVHQNIKLNISVVALKTVSLDNKRTTWKASKVKLKTNGRMSRINSNIQLWYGTASSASLLTSKFVTGLTSFNTILMTSLFVTLSKTMGFYKDVFLILVYSKLYALLSFPR